MATNEITLTTPFLTNPDILLGFSGNAHGDCSEPWVTLYVHIGTPPEGEWDPENPGDYHVHSYHLTPDDARQMAACALQALDDGKEIAVRKAAS